MKYEQKQYKHVLTSICNIMAIAKEINRLNAVIKAGDRSDANTQAFQAASLAIYEEILILSSESDCIDILMDAVNNKEEYDFKQFQLDALLSIMSKIAKTASELNDNHKKPLQDTDTKDTKDTKDTNDYFDKPSIN